MNNETTPAALPVEALAASDEQIAEAMLAVDDPLLWGRLGEGQGDMVRKFASALFATAPPAVLVAGLTLKEATQAFLDAVDKMHDTEKWFHRYRMPYAELNRLRAALAAAPSGVTEQPAPDSYLKGSGG